ncbi:MAG: PASTA domain-containing protein [Prevotella sp.]|nr:PASTA domain-containing protein [Prevotella sp.]MCF0208169.1 PASTA domain-containing protein [Bacteroidaceae bacterium]
MKEFIKSLFSLKVALNLLATIFALVALVAGTYMLLGAYTNHGEKIEVPNIKKRSLKSAKAELARLGMVMKVTDTLYLKNLPADIILEQMPAPGKLVKSGRVIYTVINAGHSPELPIPDIIENSSAREAMAIMQALGFKRLEYQYVDDEEKDWVVGLSCNGKSLKTGDIVSVEAKIYIRVGSGLYLEENVTAVPSPFYFDEDLDELNDYNSNRGSGNNNSGTQNTYTEEQVEDELESSVDAELELLMRERQQKQTMQSSGNE